MKRLIVHPLCSFIILGGSLQAQRLSSLQNYLGYANHRAAVLCSIDPAPLIALPQKVSAESTNAVPDVNASISSSEPSRNNRNIDGESGQRLRKPSRFSAAEVASSHQLSATAPLPPPLPPLPHSYPVSLPPLPPKEIIPPPPPPPPSREAEVPGGYVLEEGEEI